MLRNFFTAALEPVCFELAAMTVDMDRLMFDPSCRRPKWGLDARAAIFRKVLRLPFMNFRLPIPNEGPKLS
jgi:hypothetical protein